MKNLDLIKNDSYLAEFIKQHKIPDYYIDEHYNSFLRVLNSREKCLNCDGLEYCSQLSKGQRLSLTYDGVLIEEIEYCDYALNRKNKDSLLKKYVYCDVPKNLADVDLSNIEFEKNQKELFVLLSSILLEKSNKGLYIIGDLGVGKTYLCTGLANSLVKKGKKVAFVKVANFFNEMRAAIGSDSDIINKTINNLKNVDYLFLDDIGSESVSEFVRDDILFRILDYRMDNKMITIFTSNLNKSDLLKHYQYDRKEKANLMNAKRLIERIDILADDYVLSGSNLRRDK